MRIRPTLLLVSVLALMAVVASAETPRLSDGHPDLSGFWVRAASAAGPGAPFNPFANSPAGANEEKVIRVFQGNSSQADVNASDARNAATRRENRNARPVYKPQYAGHAMELFDSGDLKNPAFGCGLQGARGIAVPNEIFARRGAVVFLNDGLSTRARVIPIDGSPPATDEPLVMGTPRGQWQGDTLVIVTDNFVGDYWLDGDGSYYSDKLKVTERLTRKDDRLTYDVTFEDPMFAQPFVRPTVTLVPGPTGDHVGLIEYPCVERSQGNMVNGAKH